MYDYVQVVSDTKDSLLQRDNPGVHAKCETSAHALTEL